ncbi:alpha/beta hydrolase [Candidatus Saccharibacteria bacterium]|nr:alpha/beta hydrolase [Candidatus Saccharibacteria bacterium]
MENIFDDYAEIRKNIQPIDINGLKGRMIRIASKNKKFSKKEILVIYGHHASLERIYGIADEISKYGNVTAPDLPGFGGMDSFYKIGMKPTLDNMADYLATFIKLRFRNKKVTIIGMSLGFVITTRMLQRYPELSKNVDKLVSMVGFTRKDDYALSKKSIRTYTALAEIFRHRVPAVFFYNVILHPSLIRIAYAKTPNAKKKFENLSKDDQKKAMDFEVILWRDNDVRTYMEMTLEMMRLDNCHKSIDMPVHHVSVKNDQYFNNKVVEQHMRVIFNDFYEHEAVMPNHAPSIIASKEEAAPLVPKSLRKVFSS